MTQFCSSKLSFLQHCCLLRGKLESMQISKDKVVSVHYQLQVEGQTVDQSTDEPLTYLHGHNAMIPGFEKQLEGMSQGEKYGFEVTAAEGYGERNEEAVVELPKDIFLVEGVLSPQVEEGAQLQMRDQEGNPMMGTVLNVGEENIKMDFNHFLAGKALNFSGEIHEVRDASAEEVTHGHVHGAGGHSH
jgi:FKBP-type peptidyl-prolyl cis-trans isomerase SlyD